jgi:acetoacetyl-[acyl-carrier protein] synthase
MAFLPVIVGFGGVNAAGRSSSHHGFRRMVESSLSEQQRQQTYQGLASMMQLQGPLDDAQIAHINANTLIRRIGESHFDVNRVNWNRRVRLQPAQEGKISFALRAKQVPSEIPPGWDVKRLNDETIEVTILEGCEILIPDGLVAPVQAAGQLPSGFAPGELYQSRNHPRGVQMTIYGASDALQSTGLAWESIRAAVSPDQISVYAGSAMSQLDQFGNGGMMNARGFGKRVSSKQCALGFAEMPADFINAYILGSVGTTGTSMGACASFLYNLRQAVIDIQSGRSKVAIVGNAEAPITPEVMEGYAAMGALASDKELRALDGLNADALPNHRRACRPFAENCGFTIAESAQFTVLFSDDLAMALGAQVFGAVDDVFINADGHKKSISAPGVGNYVTVGKALASAQALVGAESIQRRSFVQAHGTGTPQNRVTESHVLNEAAKAFGIEDWPLVAVKSYLGHSIGVAAGDQIVATLGSFAHGILPGISTIDEVAADVHDSNLAISNAHRDFEENAMDVAIINANGFGGNNASASVLAPHVAMRMLEKKYGAGQMKVLREGQEKAAAAAAIYDQRAIQGDVSPIYKFDHDVLHGDDVNFDGQQLSLRGFDPIELGRESPYSEMI